MDELSSPGPDSHWDVIVVGSGLGGLSAAATLARQGRRVLVCEQHDVPGGYAHRFLRRVRGTDVTYSFDVALHQIGSLRPGRRLHRQLMELGVLQQLRLRRFDSVYRTRGPSHDFVVPSDAATYQDLLMREFPAHTTGIPALFETLAAADLGEGSYDKPNIRALSLLGRTAQELIEDHVHDERFVSIFFAAVGLFGAATFPVVCIFLCPGLGQLSQGRLFLH